LLIVTNTAIYIIASINPQSTMEGKPTAQTPFPTEDQDKTHFQQIANPPRRIHLMRHAQALHNVPPYNSTLPDPCLTLAGIQQTFSFTHHFLYTDQVSVILTSPMTRTLQTAVLCFPNLARSWSEEDGGTVDIASGHPTQHHHHHQGTKDERSEKKKCKIFAFPELQETSSQPCDTGSPPSHLEAQFADNGVDFSRVKEGWNVKTGIMAADKETVMERAKMSRRELGEWFGGADGGGDVVVVSHGQCPSQP
jgi:broad specificity phosphatase PhoE